VVDVFYVKDVFGLKIRQCAKGREVQRRLALALGGEMTRPARRRRKGKTGAEGDEAEADGL
jgi:hypothetical protein